MCHVGFFRGSCRPDAELGHRDAEPVQCHLAVLLLRRRLSRGGGAGRSERSAVPGREVQQDAARAAGHLQGPRRHVCVALARGGFVKDF